MAAWASEATAVAQGWNVDLVGACDTPGVPRDVFVTGDYACDGTGGLSNQDSNLTLVDRIFSGNRGSEGTCGMSSCLSRLTLINCIFWANRDEDGATETSQIEVRNSAPVLNYCCLQGWTGRWGGVGNHGDDPLFLDADGPDDVVGTPDDNLYLAVGTPCVDAGDNMALPAGIATDVNGNPRFVKDVDTSDTGSGAPPVVDMGAVEAQNFIVNAWSVRIPEGEMMTFAVSLRSNPITRVVVDVTRLSGDPALRVQAGTALAFDASDYQIPKTFFIEAAEDDDMMDGCAVFMLRTPGLRTVFLTVMQVDNDRPAPLSKGCERWMLYEKPRRQTGRRQDLCVSVGGKERATGLPSGGGPALTDRPRG